MATFYERGLFGLCGPNFFGSAAAANGNQETVARLVIEQTTPNAVIDNKRRAFDAVNLLTDMATI
jgi:hypothetical protein